MFSWGWNADYPDPENFLFLLYGPNGRVNGGVNSSNYSNPEFDRLYERMKNMDNGPATACRLFSAWLIWRAAMRPWLWGFNPKKLCPLSWLVFSTPSQTPWPTIPSNTSALSHRCARNNASNGISRLLGPLWAIAVCFLSRLRCRRLSAISAAKKPSHRLKPQSIAQANRKATTMTAYIIRPHTLCDTRFLIGINLITFALFFCCQSAQIKWRGYT